MLYNDIVKILADGLLIPIILLGAYALLWRVPKNKRFESYARVIVAGLTAFLLAKLLATAYQPMGERPFELMQTAAGASYLDNPGFPSDHALFASAITFAVWAETRVKWIIVTLIGLTLLMCLGRVLALVHTPLDIAGGIAVAAIGAMWYLTARPMPEVHTKKHAK